MGTERYPNEGGAQDQATFARIYAENFRAVCAAAQRVLGDAPAAEEVAQEVFLAFWLRPERFDPSRGPLGSYLRLVARSRALDRWRGRRAAVRAEERLSVAEARAELRIDEQPTEQAERSERAATVTAALCRLPKPQREAVLMAYGGGRTSREIAGASGIPIGTAKSRVRLGLLRLRDECEDQLAA